VGEGEFGDQQDAAAGLGVLVGAAGEREGGGGVVDLDDGPVVQRVGVHADGDDAAGRVADGVAEQFRGDQIDGQPGVLVQWGAAPGGDQRADPAASGGDGGGLAGQ